ncbi:type II secretion system protein [Terrihabitans soli]|uniref:Type II secretion system protein n=2 Tax=Terrihabitans soli TaxID=708113 RepID=A0A6S6QZF9_9HYPH|nr:type II secretion system protein [Terrihabitans soli]
MLFTGLAATMTVVTVAMPLLQRDQLGRRMKAVALERDLMRARERERIARGSAISLRREPKAYMKKIVDRFDLAKHLSTDDAKEKLTMAGYRGTAPMTVFLFFRFVTPIALFVFSLLYMFVITHFDQPAVVKLGVAIFAAYVGIKAPQIFLKNKISKRQQSIRRAFPDALDLLLICIEAGMSVEAAFRKVSQEIGEQSIALAEEFVLTSAEMSYLQDRRQAYENLANRIGLDGVRAVTGALIQSERYGTPIAQSLRVMAQENRDMRMNEAEKKAAALPPKLTVPMIVFFLPVLFIVIIGPAIMQVMDFR